MKAIVMETRGREAAILLRDGTFRTVKGRYSVGETIDYREKAQSAFRKWIAAAAAAVIMIGTGGGFWYDANYVAYAEISLDVNPSIVYTVNKRSRVLSVRAVNDEASETVSALEKEGIRFMPVAEAIDRTMTLFENEGYLDADNEDYVLINVSTDQAGIQESVISEIETGMGRAMERDPSMEYRVDHSDRATARRAEESDMSTGRYAVWEQEGGDRRPEEYAEMTVRELMGKPDETVPAVPEESGPQQTEEDTHMAPAEGMQPHGTPENPNQQPAQAPETGDNPNSPNESNAPSVEQEQNEKQGTEPYEPQQGRDEGAAEDKQVQQPAAPEEKPGESPKKGSQPPSEAQTGAGAEPTAGRAPQPMRQAGRTQDLSSPPNRDMKGKDMSQDAPGNVPGGPGNQPPK